MMVSSWKVRKVSIVMAYSVAVLCNRTTWEPNRSFKKCSTATVKLLKQVKIIYFFNLIYCYFNI